MPEQSHSYRPSLSEVLQVAFSAEQYTVTLAPANEHVGPTKPSKIGQFAGKIARATGFYSLLKDGAPDPIDAALSDPNRPLTLTQAVQLGLRQG